MAEYDTEAKFDVEKVHDLLDVVDMTRDQPTLKPIHDEALRALAAIAAEILAKLEEAKEKADATRYTPGVRPGSQQAAGTGR